MAVKFSLDRQTRRQLIALLFTGGYANEVAQVRLRHIFATLFRRLAA